jgi:hypothetical protein
MKNRKKTSPAVSAQRCRPGLQPLPRTSQAAFGGAAPRRARDRRETAKQRLGMPGMLQLWPEIPVIRCFFSTKSPHLWNVSHGNNQIFTIYNCYFRP